METQINIHLDGEKELFLKEWNQMKDQLNICYLSLRYRSDDKSFKRLSEFNLCFNTGEKPLFRVFAMNANSIERFELCKETFSSYDMVVNLMHFKVEDMKVQYFKLQDRMRKSTTHPQFHLFPISSLRDSYTAQYTNFYEAFKEILTLKLSERIEQADINLVEMHPVRGFDRETAFKYCKNTVELLVVLSMNNLWTDVCNFTRETLFEPMVLLDESEELTPMVSLLSFEPNEFIESVKEETVSKIDFFYLKLQFLVHSLTKMKDICKVNEVFAWFLSKIDSVPVENKEKSAYFGYVLCKSLASYLNYAKKFVFNENQEKSYFTAIALVYEKIINILGELEKINGFSGSDSSELKVELLEEVKTVYGDKITDQFAEKTKFHENRLDLVSRLEIICENLKNPSLSLPFKQVKWTSLAELNRIEDLFEDGIRVIKGLKQGWNSLKESFLVVLSCFSDEISIELVSEMLKIDFNQKTVKNSGYSSVESLRNKIQQNLENPSKRETKCTADRIKGELNEETILIKNETGYNLPITSVTVFFKVNDNVYSKEEKTEEVLAETWNFSLVDFKCDLGFSCEYKPERIELRLKCGIILEIPIKTEKYLKSVEKEECLSISTQNQGFFNSFHLLEIKASALKEGNSYTCRIETELNASQTEFLVENNQNYKIELFKENLSSTYLEADFTVKCILVSNSTHLIERKLTICLQNSFNFALRCLKRDRLIYQLSISALKDLSFKLDKYILTPKSACKLVFKSETKLESLRTESEPPLRVPSSLLDSVSLDKYRVKAVLPYKETPILKQFPISLEILNQTEKDNQFLLEFNKNKNWKIRSDSQIFFFVEKNSSLSLDVLIVPIFIGSLSLPSFNLKYLKSEEADFMDPASYVNVPKSQLEANFPRISVINN